jgi:hypothetical protein
LHALAEKKQNDKIKRRQLSDMLLADHSHQKEDSRINHGNTKQKLSNAYGWDKHAMILLARPFE